MSLALRQQCLRQVIEGIALRLVTPDKAADLPAEQRCKTDQKQRAAEFAGGDGANEKSRYRHRDHGQETERGGIDARPEAADQLRFAAGLSHPRMPLRDG